MACWAWRRDTSKWRRIGGVGWDGAGGPVMDGDLSRGLSVVGPWGDVGSAGPLARRDRGTESFPGDQTIGDERGVFKIACDVGTPTGRNECDARPIAAPGAPSHSDHLPVTILRA